MIHQFKSLMCKDMIMNKKTTLRGGFFASILIKRLSGYAL